MAKNAKNANAAEERFQKALAQGSATSFKERLAVPNRPRTGGHRKNATTRPKKSLNSGRENYSNTRSCSRYDDELPLRHQASSIDVQRRDSKVRLQLINPVRASTRFPARTRKLLTGQQLATQQKIDHLMIWALLGFADR